MHTERTRSVQLITIPSSDPAFRAHVDGIDRDVELGPAGFEQQLRRIFPRVVVRERVISGEPTAWYVYRDGGWRSSTTERWWDDPSLPRVVVTSDGWLADVSATAAGLLEIDPAAAHEHHFTDFILPGTLEDSLALFAVVEGGSDLTATVLLRPLTGDVVAVDLHASSSGDRVVGVLRLAADVDTPVEAEVVPRPATLTTLPAIDVAFRAYALRALARMPEPTIAGLALRLHRLYPHATVRPDGEAWTVEREAGASRLADPAWWGDEGLPRVRYDAQALILEANDAARQFLGHGLVGHYWQDFVTPGSAEEVNVMLAILAEVGAAQSRFRMPRADGRMVEFDSYTTVAGEEFVTVMKPTDR